MIRFEMTRSCGADFVTVTVSSRIDKWHKHIDGLFDESLWDTLLAQERRLLRSTVRCSDPLLWNGSEGPPGNKRELRLRTTVFAGV